MSEFSESLHLRSTDMGQGIALLRRARVPGHVLRADRGWVPMVVPVHLGSDAVERVVAANAGVLVHYVYAEDHEVKAVAYRAAERIARVFVSFETDEATFERAQFVAEGLMTDASAEDVQQWIDEGRERGVLAIAAALGLARHEWFSFESIDRDRGRPSPGHVEVSANGTVVSGAVDEPESAPTHGAAEAPALFEELALVLKRLIDDGSLILTDDAELDDLGHALAAALSETDGDSPARAILACLIDHSMVEEVFADEEAVARALSFA